MKLAQVWFRQNVRDYFYKQWKTQGRQRGRNSGKESNLRQKGIAEYNVDETVIEQNQCAK